jgi:5-deoxy-D-glucuronate isomerase
MSDPGSREKIVVEKEGEKEATFEEKPGWSVCVCARERERVHVTWREIERVCVCVCEIKIKMS